MQAVKVVSQALTWPTAPNIWLQDSLHSRPI